MPKPGWPASIRGADKGLAPRLALKRSLGVTSKSGAEMEKRRAACASHASRLVKCDVSKVRHNPYGPRRCSCLPLRSSNQVR